MDSTSISYVETHKDIKHDKMKDNRNNAKSVKTLTLHRAYSYKTSIKHFISTAKLMLLTSCGKDNVCI